VAILVRLKGPTGSQRWRREGSWGNDCIVLQITLNSGRSVQLKQKFYKTIADGLHAAVKLRREDVFINLIEVPKENWSFGNGEAQYVTTDK
jgi:phenylpyruvate tautomerase PptA (4-oxalocrotonate tautomerase family)